jgi:hypothetical protein
MRRIEAYRVKNRDNIGDPEFWNRRFEELDNRLHKHDQDLADVNAIGDRVEGAALDRINNVVTPLVEEARERFSSVTAIFYATSLSEIGVSAGEKTFNIEPDFRGAFAPLAFLFIHPIGSRANGLVVSVESFNRTSGNLVVNVEQVIGAGIFSAWAIEPVASTADLEALRDAVEGLRDNAAAAAFLAEGARDAALIARGASEAARDQSVGAASAIFGVYRGVSNTPPAGGVAGQFYVNTGVDPVALTFHTGSGWLVNEPLPARLSEASLDTRYRNASNLNAGTVPNARLPLRLREEGQQTINWDAATPFGNYWSARGVDGVVNTPDGPAGTNYWAGKTWGYDTGHFLQRLTKIDHTSADTQTWQRRYTTVGGWSAWYRIRESQDELDARYAGVTYQALVDRGSRGYSGSNVNFAATAGQLDQHWALYGADHTITIPTAASLGAGAVFGPFFVLDAIVVSFVASGADVFRWSGANVSSFPLAKCQHCWLRSAGAGAWDVIGYQSEVVIYNSGPVANVAALDLIFPPGYRQFRIEGHKFIPQTTNQNLVARYRTQSTATYRSGASDYRDARSNVTGVNSIGGGYSNTTNGMWITAGTNPDGHDFILNVFNPRNSGRHTQQSGLVVGDQNLVGFDTRMVSGRNNTPEDNDAIRFFIQSGNINADNLRLVGIV